MKHDLSRLSEDLNILDVIPGARLRVNPRSEHERETDRRNARAYRLRKKAQQQTGAANT